MKVHGEQIVAGSISTSKLNLPSIVDALTVTTSVLGGNDIVADLRDEYAFDAVWSVHAAATPATVKPWQDASRITTDYNVKIVLVNATDRDTTQKDAKNLDVLNSVIAYLFPPIEFSPTVGDTIAFNSCSYRVASIREHAPSGIPLLYILRLDR